MRRTSQFRILLSGILAMTIAVGGVYATWTYAMNLADSAQSDMNATMGTWDYSYTITFINNGVPIQIENESGIKEDAVIDVTDNTQTIDLTTNDIANAAGAQAATDMGEGYAFSHWINAGSTQVDTIDAGNTEDIILYPAFKNVYTAIFVNQQGDILAWGTYIATEYSDFQLGGAKELEARNVLNIQLQGTDFVFESWEVHVTNDLGETIATHALTSDFDFSELTCDVTIYPVLEYQGDVNLIPVDNNGDGETDEYQVGGYKDTDAPTTLVEIPSDVDGDDVTEINGGAFKEYADLTAVRIPASVTSIGSKAFADSGSFLGNLTDRQTVTLYYEGTKEQWDTYMSLMYDDDDTNNPFASDWDYAMGEGSRVFFLVDGKVDLSKGYWELNKIGWTDARGFEWNYHNHAFPYDSTLHTSCEHPDDHNQNDTDYDAASRPDKEYWLDENGNPIYP